MLSSTLIERRPWVPYVAPFAIFMLLLVGARYLGLPARGEAALRVGLTALAIVVFARPVLDFRVSRPLASMAVGVAIFALWVGPDLLLPGHRDSAIFQNPLTGYVESSLGEDARRDWVVLSLRMTRAAVLVPIVEELFWRGWLPRWVDRPDDFRAVPLGQFSRMAFWATAVLFAVEHGPHWDVGLAAGVIFNWWMIRTRRLGDLMLCHAVTNACLGAFVLATGRWEYW